MKGLDFTAIDFETANGSRSSACSVGLARVVGGEIVDTATWLIRPPGEHYAFAPHNIKVHGITADQVVDAPEWGDVLPQVMAFSGGASFVAHNASFDESVFSSVTTASGLVVPDAAFHCSLELSEQNLQLGSYKLSAVCDALGLPAFMHHEARADAMACANVVLEIARRSEQGTLAGLWSTAPLRSSTKYSGVARIDTTTYTATKKLSELPQANPDADPTTLIHGQVFVFTGEMTAMDRDAAMEAVAKHGGSNGNNITKKTTVLVAATTGTGKERKARDYMALGQNIRIISEQDFLTMLATVGSETVIPAPAKMREPSIQVPVATKEPVPRVRQLQRPSAAPAPTVAPPVQRIPAPQPAPESGGLVGILIGLGKRIFSAVGGK
jgi:DNA polymerase-3 subunit epsilon